MSGKCSVFFNYNPVDKTDKLLIKCGYSENLHIYQPSNLKLTVDKIKSFKEFEIRGNIVLNKFKKKV